MARKGLSRRSLATFLILRTNITTQTDLLQPESSHQQNYPNLKRQLVVWDRGLVTAHIKPVHSLLLSWCRRDPSCAVMTFYLQPPHRENVLNCILEHLHTLWSLLATYCHLTNSQSFSQLKYLTWEKTGANIINFYLNFVVNC